MFKVKNVLTLILGIGLAMTGFENVQAAKNTTVEDNLGYSVKVISTENTVKEQTFWNIDLTGNYGTDLTYEYVIKNIKNVPITLEIAALNGYSQMSGGGIAFEPKSDIGTIHEKSYEFNQYVKKIDKKITIPAGQEKKGFITINVPKFNGEIVGGISFFNPNQEEIKDEKNKKKEAGFNVNKEFTAIVAFQMFGEKIESENPFISKEVSTNFVKGLRLNWVVENPNPLISIQKVDYKVLDSKNKVIQEGNYKAFKMAPMTNVTNSITYEGTVEPGSYILEVNGTKLPFTITKETVEEVKLRSPEKAINVTNVGFSTVQVIMIAVGSAFVVLILIGIAFLLWKNKNKKKTEQEKKN
jgi:hypothetical protein